MIIKLQEVIRRNWITLIFFLIIFLSRLIVLNKDAVQFWADESRYPGLIDNIDKFSKSGNYNLLIRQFFYVDARPGANLFYFPAAFLEWKNPDIPFGAYYNLVINTAWLIIIFFIIKKFQNKNSAIIITFLIFFSITPLIYIRHMLPYDISLLLLLIGLYLYSYFNKIFIFGLLAGFSFLTYPSYYYYIIPIPLILFICRKSIKSALVFLFGFFFILISIQFLSSAVAENTYFRSLQDQSGGVTAISQGDYISAASYVGEYILAADGYWNLFLIIIGTAGVLLLKDRRKIVLFCIYLISVFLILELFSHILQKHVLYGRTIRPLYLLTLGFSVLVFERVLSQLKSKKIYTAGVSILLIGSILNWLPRFLSFKNLVYPLQFQQKSREYLDIRYKQYELVTDTFDTGFVNFWNSESPFPNWQDSGRKLAESGKYYAINAVQIFPYYGNYDISLYCKSEVLIKQPHIQYLFKPYQFEGYKKFMRKKIEEDPLYYQLIYCN